MTARLPAGAVLLLRGLTEDWRRAPVAFRPFGLFVALDRLGLVECTRRRPAANTTIHWYVRRTPAGTEALKAAQ